MQIINEFIPVPTAKWCTCLHWNGQTAIPQALFLAAEHALELWVNGALFCRFTCTPAHLAELCLGHLLLRGVIHAPSDLCSLHISADGRNAEATILQSGYRTPPASVIPELSAALLQKAWSLFQTPDTLHVRTHGTHECSFISASGEINLFEDISRSNAVRKAVGGAWLQGLCLQQGGLLLSARVTSEMVRDCAQAGIPVLIGKGVPSAAAADLAEKEGIKLVVWGAKNI